METRSLTEAELEELRAGRGTHLRVTCEHDYGYGPCGTYHDWTDGLCSVGHEIEILEEEEGV